MSLCTWGRLGLGLGFLILPFIVRHMAAQQLLDLVANATASPCFRVRVRVRVFHQTVYSAPHGSITIVRFSCKCNCWPMSQGQGQGQGFHRIVYSAPHGNTTTIRFSCKCKSQPMFQGQGQGQGFSSDRLQCTTWQHNNCQIQLQMQLLAHVLGLGLGFLSYRLQCSKWQHNNCQIQLQMQLLAHVLGLGFFIRPFIVRHMVAQQLLDLIANATAGPCFRVRVRVRVFHQTVYSAPHGNTTTIRFSCKCNYWPMFQGQGQGFPSYMLNMFQGQGQGQGLGL